jgi:hypothetical protein
VKPDIVFFGERLPRRFNDLSRVDAPKADLLLIFGTSLLVEPFSTLANSMRPDCVRLFVNADASAAQRCSLRRFRPTTTSSGGSSAAGEERMGRASPAGGEETAAAASSRDAIFVGDCDEASTLLCQHLGWTADLESLMSATRRRRDLERNTANDKKKNVMQHDDVPLPSLIPTTEDAVPAEGERFGVVSSSNTADDQHQTTPPLVLQLLGPHSVVISFLVSLSRRSLLVTMALWGYRVDCPPSTMNHNHHGSCGSDVATVGPAVTVVYNLGSIVALTLLYCLLALKRGNVVVHTTGAPPTKNNEVELLAATVALVMATSLIACAMVPVLAAALLEFGLSPVIMTFCAATFLMLELLVSWHQHASSSSQQLPFIYDCTESSGGAAAAFGRSVAVPLAWWHVSSQWALSESEPSAPSSASAAAVAVAASVFGLLVVIITSWWLALRRSRAGGATMSNIAQLSWCEVCTHCTSVMTAGVRRFKKTRMLPNRSKKLVVPTVDDIGLAI